jgi:hypothetical protein
MLGVEIGAAGLRPGGGVAPGLDLDFASGAYTSGRRRRSGPEVVPGWSFARASAARARLATGVVGVFAADAFRRVEGGLLIEEPRQNLMLQSQRLDQSPWTRVGTTVQADAAASPDGATSADRLVMNVSTDLKRTQQVVATTAGATYAASIFVKPDPLTTLASRFSAVEHVVFNLATGTAAVTGTQITGAAVEALAGGWFRCGFVFTASGPSTTIFWGPSLGNTAGNGADGLLLWQADVQPGRFVTSPIETTGAVGSRAAEMATVAGLEDGEALTLMLAFKRVGAAAVETTLAQADDGSEANRLVLAVSAGGAVVARVVAAGVGLGEVVGPSAGVGQAKRAAARLEAGRLTLVADGAVVGSVDLSAPEGLNRLKIGGSAATTAVIGRATAAPRALSDLEMTRWTAP